MVENPQSNRTNKRGGGWIGRFDPSQKWGSEVHGDIRAQLFSDEDAFGRVVVENTKNLLDLPSHYDLNPERYRVKENGTRVAANGSAKLTDSTNSFIATANAGDNVVLYSAERPRYVVGYDSIASWGAKLNDALESGDSFKIGLRDYRTPENQIYFEFNGGPNRAVIENQGTEVASKSFTMPEGASVLNPIRYAIEYNAYFVGRCKFTVNFTDSDRPENFQQRQERVAELVVDDDWWIGEANLHLFFELDVDTGNTTKSADFGSMAYQVMGNITPTVRSKAARFLNNTSGSHGLYEAVLAIRVDPNRSNVFVDIAESEVVFTTGNGELLLISVDPDNTDADFITDPTGDGTTPGPVAPPQHNPTNSVIQYTKDVSTFPDKDGNLVTTASDPGGYQVSFATDSAGQTGSSGATRSSLLRKRPLHSDNVVIFLQKRDNPQSATTKITFETEQDW